VSNAEFKWREATPAEVDFQYSPSQHAKRPLPEYLEEYHQLSEQHQSKELVAAHTPLLIYIHGGYWQKLSAADSLFNADDALKENVSLHAVEYTIAPQASIETMIDECVADVLQTIADVSPTHVVLSGCSAGAHLAAMCARHPEVSPLLEGVVLLSGIYDLRPLVVTPTNDPLGLDNERAAKLSPQLLPADVFPAAALLVVGEYESSEFIRQNTEYGNYLSAAGTCVDTAVVADRDHFDLPYDLLRRGTLVGDWTLTKLGRNAS
jgi:arylformamidase